MAPSSDNSPETRSARLEVRVTPTERALIDRAVGELGIDRSTFIVDTVLTQAQHVMAERQHVVLPSAAQSWWDDLMARPITPMPGLRELFDRPSPFTTQE